MYIYSVSSKTEKYIAILLTLQIIVSIALFFTLGNLLTEVRILNERTLEIRDTVTRELPGFEVILHGIRSVLNDIDYTLNN